MNPRVTVSYSGISERSTGLRDGLLSSSHCDYTAHVAGAVFRGRFPRAIEPDRCDLRSGDRAKAADRSELLTVDVDSRIGLRVILVETCLATIAQKIRAQLLNRVVRSRCARCFNLLLRDYLGVRSVAASDGRW